MVTAVSDGSLRYMVQHRWCACVYVRHSILYCHGVLLSLHTLTLHTHTHYPSLTLHTLTLHTHTHYPSLTLHTLTLHIHTHYPSLTLHTHTRNPSLTLHTHTRNPSLTLHALTLCTPSPLTTGRFVLHHPPCCNQPPHRPDTAPSTNDPNMLRGSAGCGRWW